MEYSSQQQLASPLRELTCHMGSHIIICHQQRWQPAFTAANTGRYSIFWPQRDARLSWPSWLGYIPRWYTRHPSSNRAQCRATLFMWITTLPLQPSHQHYRHHRSDYSYYYHICKDYIVTVTKMQQRHWTKQKSHVMSAQKDAVSCQLSNDILEERRFCFYLTTIFSYSSSVLLGSSPRVSYWNILKWRKPNCRGWKGFLMSTWQHQNTDSKLTNRSGSISLTRACN